jgi:hypothetical protein
MKIFGICSSCFSKTIFDRRPQSGLCVVCSNCGAILESLHVVSSAQDWPHEDGESIENDDFDTVLRKRNSEEKDRWLSKRKTIED